MVFLICIALAIIWFAVLPEHQSGYVNLARGNLNAAKGFYLSAGIVSLVLVFSRSHGGNVEREVSNR